MIVIFGIGGSVMRFYRRMYLAKDCIDEKSKIKRCLKHRKMFPDYVVITMGAYTDQLEVMHSALLAQPVYKNKELLIIGAAKNKQDAFELLTQLASDAFAAGYSGNLREYILSTPDAKQKE